MQIRDEDANKMILHWNQQAFPLGVNKYVGLVTGSYVCVSQCGIERTPVLIQSTTVFRTAD